MGLPGGTELAQGGQSPARGALKITQNRVVHSRDSIVIRQTIPASSKEKSLFKNKRDSVSFPLGAPTSRRDSPYGLAIADIANRCVGHPRMDVESTITMKPGWKSRSVFLKEEE